MLPPYSVFRQAFPQILAVSVKNILIIGFGMTLGFPTIAIPAIKDTKDRIEDGELRLSLEQISWFSSINYICVPLGACVSGLVTQPFGRKRSMQMLNIPMIAAWVLFHYSTAAEHLYIGLSFCGIAGGLLEAPVLTYVAEITQPHLRGMLSASSSLCITIGVFTQFLLGTFLDWRTIALINISFPLAAIICLSFVPESPHWLISKNRLEDAKQSLMWLRGWVPVEDIRPEYDELYNQIKKSEESEKRTCLNNVANFKKKNFLLPYFIVSFAFFVGHFSGMTTLQTFAVQIFDELKAPIDAYYATMILGIVQLIGTLLCVILVHYIGKRPLTFVSATGCGLCFFIVATYAFFVIDNPGKITDDIATNITHLAGNSTIKDVLHTFDINATELVSSGTDYSYLQGSSNITDGGNLPANSTSYQWIPMTFLITSAFLSHVGIRLTPWMLIGEVFPLETRGVAAGLSGGLGYVFGFFANKTFLNMTLTLSLPGTFWFYSGVSIVGVIVLYFILPETEGMTLKTIEMHFNGEINLLKKTKNEDKNAVIRSSVIRNKNENEHTF